MKRALLLYDTPGWAYHRRCLALQEYAPPGWAVDIAPGANARYWYTDYADIVLQLCYGRIVDSRVMMFKRESTARLVAGLNIGWSEEADVYLRILRVLADHVVVNSQLVLDAAGSPPGVTAISNGVRRDEGHYEYRVPIERRTPRVLWTGSIFHRATKNFDTLLGPLRQRLEARGIPCDFRLVDSHGGEDRWSTSRMCEWYNTGTVYVCASRREGTPNPALEAASCGCTVVSTPVGNMPELIVDGVNGLLVAPELDVLEAGVLRAVDQYEPWAEAMQETIREWDWRMRAPAYFDLFARLLTV